MSDDCLFTEVDPRGYAVSLSSMQYNRHIIQESGHTTVTPDNIRFSISVPDVIYKSTYPDAYRMVYFSDFAYDKEGFYLKTITEVENVNEKTSHVVTSFPVKEIDGGIDDSKEGRLYDCVSS